MTGTKGTKGITVPGNPLPPPDPPWPRFLCGGRGLGPTEIVSVIVALGPPLLLAVLPVKIRLVEVPAELVTVKVTV